MLKPKMRKPNLRSNSLCYLLTAGSTAVNLPTHPPIDAVANDSHSVDVIVSDRSYAAALAEPTEQCIADASMREQPTAHGKLTISTYEYADPLGADAVDDVNAGFLRSSTANIAPTALFLSTSAPFNKSLACGQFLDDWKVTSITPIFKTGNKNGSANYRPIAKAF